MDYVPKKADKKAKQASLPTGAGVLLGAGDPGPGGWLQGSSPTRRRPQRQRADLAHEEVSITQPKLGPTNVHLPSPGGDLIPCEEKSRSAIRFAQNKRLLFPQEAELARKRYKTQSVLQKETGHTSQTCHSATVIWG